ncbi:MAG: restriction endonuclease [Phycisphaerales bacterium JB060]
MAVWLVRAGSGGEREDLALENDLVVVGWNEVPDLAAFTSRDEIMQVFERAYPDEKVKTLQNWVGQMYAFRSRIAIGDIVVLPLKGQPLYAFGKVTGDYVYRKDLPEDARHTRAVDWINTELPKSSLGTDLQYSLGAFMTVCQIQRNNAEERIRGVLAGKKDEEVSPPIEADGPTDADGVPTSIETLSATQIRIHISKVFGPKKFERLVEEVLKAQGYSTERTTEGADGGVDIVAGRGPMGFDEPRLAVQVKSGEGPEDIRTVRELQGVLRNFNAQRGLLVSWGGYKRSVMALKRQLFFEIRLWTGDDLIEAVLETYDRLPDDIKADLPLKRIWTLVQEGDDPA